MVLPEMIVGNERRRFRTGMLSDFVAFECGWVEFTATPPVSTVKSKTLYPAPDLLLASGTSFYREGQGWGMGLDKFVFVKVGADIQFAYHDGKAWTEGSPDLQMMVIATVHGRKESGGYIRAEKRFLLQIPRLGASTELDFTKAQIIPLTKTQGERLNFYPAGESGSVMPAPSIVRANL
jgi:hypothetical protein